MRFMTLVKSAETSTPPPQALMDAIGKLGAEAAGTEAKEVIGGFAVYAVTSKEEALDWTRRFMALHQEHWKGWEGEVELRQMYDPPGGAS